MTIIANSEIVSFYMVGAVLNAFCISAHLLTHNNPVR